MFCSLSWNDTKDMYKSWLKWKEGRQKTGYFGMLLFLNPFLIPFHIVILKFPKGASIPPHKDVAKGRRHFRLNLILKHAKKGGEFKTEGYIFKSKYLNFLRSDICKHEVTTVEEGSRYVFSIGWTVI